LKSYSASLQATNACSPSLLGPMMSAGPHPQVPLTQAQIAQQQQAQAQASELAKRRSRKPTDKNMPDGVEDCIIDAEAVQRYKDLRSVERRLDAAMTRKRLDMFDTVNRNAKVSKMPWTFCLPLQD
jgi:SWI/SNF-related matrix-associated actin-dependent regulator of chromatin subfamily D